MRRGAIDEPLPDTAVILRANRLPPDWEPGRPITRAAFQFELSSRDKEQPVPKLSVYVEGLTTPEQACALVGDGTTHRLVAYLRVFAVRAILQNEHRLDVVWDEALLDDGTPDTRPGAQGHAGITGLKRPPNMPRVMFKALQSQLADAVGSHFVIIPKPGSL